MGFYEKYIETVTKNDVRTRNSVDAIIGRIDELLDDRPDGRLSGLVVGRVQSGKTRFNGLFTDQVLAENGIAKTCGRPITWQYQG